MKKVIIFRGFSGALFSTGMDRLGEKIELACPDVEVTVDGYESWLKHFAQIYDSKDECILIGHSFGALACFKILNMAKYKKFPLVCSFDYSPYYSGLVGHMPDGIVPDNAVNAINFYQQVDPLVRGVKMEREDGSETNIENIIADMAHVEIDKSDDFHKIVIRAIKAL